MTGAALGARGVGVADFAEAMTRLAGGLAVVTGSGPGGEPCGLLVSSLCSYSVRPPSVLVCLDHASRSHAAMVACGEFGVHVLGDGDAATATAFARRGVDRFADTQWEWEGPVPRLRAQVYLRCTTATVHSHGDHSILIGEVTECAVSEGTPLLYYRRELTWRLRRDG